MTQETTDGRRVVRPAADPLQEAVGRALCGLFGLPPDELVRGVTGAYWTQWDYVALHQGTTLLASLNAAGFDVLPMEAAHADAA